MNTDSEKKILVVGIGNTLRSDDGVGAYICQKIEELEIPGVTTLIVQQLLLELIEDMAPFDHVLLVDAAINSTEVILEPLANGSLKPISSSHHVNASLLQTLAKKLYNKTLSLYLCTIPGFNFNTGDSLSLQTKDLSKNAIAIIKKWLEGNFKQD